MVILTFILKWFDLSSRNYIVFANDLVLLYQFCPCLLGTCFKTMTTQALAMAQDLKDDKCLLSHLYWIFTSKKESYWSRACIVKQTIHNSTICRLPNFRLTQQNFSYEQALVDYNRNAWMSFQTANLQASIFSVL